MKKTYPKIARVSTGLCLLTGLAAYNAHAAINYFDPTGTTGTAESTSAWEGNVWSTASTGQASPVAWTDSTAGNLAVFSAGVGTSGQSYTVTANVNHTAAGIFNGGVGSSIGGLLTINGASGVVINIGTAIQGFDTASSLATTTINAVLGGTGGVQSQGSGSLFLNGANTYSGGTQFSTSAGVNFNNNSSFGTGFIQFGTVSTGTQQTVMAATGSSPITLANNVIANEGQHIIVTTAAAPVTFNGSTFTLAAGGTLTYDVSAANSVVKILNKVTGASGFTKTGNGSVIFGNTANNNTGLMTITTGTVGASANNVFSSVSKITLNGGTLAVSGTSQSSVATLGLTGSSTIDFANTAGTLSLANSSANAWTAGKTISVINFNPNIDTLQVGTDATGLGSGQLADIIIDGGSLGSAGINSFGDVYLVPEPTTFALGALGGLGMLWMAKRRKA